MKKDHGDDTVFGQKREKNEEKKEDHVISKMIRSKERCRKARKVAENSSGTAGIERPQAFARISVEVEDALKKICTSLQKKKKKKHKSYFKSLDMGGNQSLSARIGGYLFLSSLKPCKNGDTSLEEHGHLSACLLLQDGIRTS
ncbi:hypothetical protein Tco_0746366 [Tanacetum coccineum]